MRLPLAPIACSLLSFVAGYVAFHPGWWKAAPMSDGSAESFRAAAEAISTEDLLEKVSPQERVGRLLEQWRRARGYQRDFAIYEAVQRLQPEDFLTAFADLEKLGKQMVAMPQEDRGALIHALIERWLDVDKAGALEALAAARVLVDRQTLKLPELQFGDLDPVYSALARRDPEWMHQAVETLGPKTRRATAVRALLRETVTRNPQKAREWLAAWRGTNDGEMALYGFMEGLEASDPKAAFAAALSEKDPEKRDQFSRDCLEATAKDDPALMLEMLSQIEPKRRLGVLWERFNTVLSNMVGDPFAWVQERFTENPELASQASVDSSKWYWLAALIRRDPVKTLDWVNTLPQDSQGHARTQALEAWSHYDPSGLLDWLTAQPLEKLPAHLPNIDFSMIESARYLAWANALPSGSTGDAMRIALSNQLANLGKADEAMHAFPKDLTSETARMGVQETASTLASWNLPGTAAWVNQLPDGPMQVNAAAGLVSFWARRNPREAAKWVGSLPAGASRDAASSTLAKNLVGSDPEAASGWLDRIGDPALRTQTIVGIFSSWPQTDAARFQWLQSRTDAPDSLKLYLVNRGP